MADSKKSNSKKVMDVAHPNQSAPAGNSKSVIVNNRPIMKDPMFVEDADEKSDKKPDAMATKPTNVVIKPVTETDNEPDDEKKTISVLAEEAASKKESVSEDEAKDEADADADKPKTETEYPGLAPDDKPKTKSDDEIANEEELELAKQEKHEAEIQKLIDSKKYELPINSIEQRKSKRVVILGIALSLVLMLAWADIALDASLIQINGIKPLTHFFSN